HARSLVPLLEEQFARGFSEHVARNRAGPTPLAGLDRHISRVWRTPGDRRGRVCWTPSTNERSRMLEVLEAGFSPNAVPYLEGWELQRHIHAEVVELSRPETLILLEHEAVFTAGSRTRPDERPSSSATPVIDVDRGGKITWHGPGQLVGYPIIHVADRGNAVAIVRGIERMLIDLIAPFGITGVQIPDRSGVWVPRADGSADKIAAIGMRVHKGVTMHG